MLAHVFGPWTQWPEQDLVAFSEEFDQELAVAAYCSGLFPMPLNETGFEGEMGWWSPVERGILPLHQLRVTRSLRKMAKRYRTSLDVCFGQVLERCADPTREHGWIDDQIRDVYLSLHERGVAHSVETWDEQGRLVGGLYGISLGGLFAGESMFHDPELGRDASKVALLRLVTELRRDDVCRLLDVQWRTDHLASLGVVEVERVNYLGLLDGALELPGVEWPEPRDGTASPTPGSNGSVMRGEDLLDELAAWQARHDDNPPRWR